MDETERHTPTDLAPPMSERDPERITITPEAPKTMLPEPRTPSDFKEVAVNDVLAAQRQLQTALDELLGPAGRLEAQTAAIAAVVERAATRQIQTYDLLRQDVMRRFDLGDARDAAQDAKLAEIIGRVEAIERAQLSEEFRAEFRELKSTLLGYIEASGYTDKTALAGRKVLLVDDQELLLRSMTKILGSCGAAVLTASKLETVKLLAEKFDPDCVMVDVQLGLNESGEDVVRWLLANGYAASRVMFMSGDAGPVPTKMAAGLGVALVEKPPAIADLVRMIREASATRPN